MSNKNFSIMMLGIVIIVILSLYVSDRNKHNKLAEQYGKDTIGFADTIQAYEQHIIVLEQQLVEDDEIIKQLKLTQCKQKKL